MAHAQLSHLRSGGEFNARVDAAAVRLHALAMEPHNRTLQGGVAADRNRVAGLSLDVGDATGALAASAPAWAALTAMIAEDPANDAWLAQRRWLAFHHGRALLGCGRAAEAATVLAGLPEAQRQEREAVLALQALAAWTAQGA